MLRRPATAERAVLIDCTFFLISSDNGTAIKRRILDFVSSIRQKIFFSFKFLAEFFQSFCFYLTNTLSGYTQAISYKLQSLLFGITYTLMTQKYLCFSRRKALLDFF